MKGKFTSADVRAIVGELLSIPGFIGSRVVNVYDLSTKTYIIKLATASDKIMLLVDAGFRFHITTYQRNLPDAPSPFTMILRKLRRKRVDSINQLGFDRVVDMQFSGGDGVNHLLLEFYAGGNIVLTDENYEVLALLRSHQFADEVVLKVGEIYPVAYATQLSLLIAPTNWNSAADHPFYTYETFMQWLKIKVDQSIAFEANAVKEGKKKGKPFTLRQLLLAKDGGISYLGPEFLDHAIALAGFKANWKLDQIVTQLTSEQFDSLCQAIRDCLVQMEKLRDHASGGYILYNVDSANKLAAGSNNTSSESKDSEGSSIPTTVILEPDFEEFSPMFFAQHASLPDIAKKHFPTFNHTVDTYFFRAEDQKLQREWLAKEEAARKKLHNVQEEHEKMLQGLGQQQRDLQDAATLLDLFADNVNKAILVINSALQAELTWPQIEDMVQLETSRGNPIASLISKLKLEENMIVVQLPRAALQQYEDEEDEDIDNEEEDVEKEEHDEEDQDSSEGSDDEEEGREKSSRGKGIKQKGRDKKQQNHNQKNQQKQKQLQKQNHKQFLYVDIDLTLSAQANASRLYSNKKAAYAKEVKTITAATKVLENLKLQTVKVLETASKKPGAGNTATPTTRKVHWFEKFHWFITSEGFLVISGRDAHQNDMLIRRYLRQEDVYVHADVAGAASCIVKAKRQNSEHVQGPAVIDSQEKFFITPLAIQEAGVFAVCRSRAWQAKLLTSAYWVRAVQVSKKAPSGEYLSTGSFMIYGKKNYLPPMPLEMGFGVLFRVADECVAGHVKDRRVKAYDVDSETASTLWQDAEDRYGLGSAGLDLPPTLREEEEEEENEAEGIEEVGVVVEESMDNRVDDEDEGGQDEDDEEEDNVDMNPETDVATNNNMEEDVADEDQEEEQPEEEEEEEEEKEEEEGKEEEEEEEHGAEQPVMLMLPPASGRAKDNKFNNNNDNNDNNNKNSKKADKNNNNKKKDSSNAKDNNKKSNNKKNNTQKKKGTNNKDNSEEEEEDHHKNLDKHETSTVTTSQTSIAKRSNSKKTLNKKKARRYAEQDDEDRELAMLVLGHASKKTGETLHTQRMLESEKVKQETLLLKQEKLGVSSLLLQKKNPRSNGSSSSGGGGVVDDSAYQQEIQGFLDRICGSDVSVREEWSKLLSPDTTSTTNTTTNTSLVNVHDICEAEIRAFSILPPRQALEVLTLFRDGLESRATANNNNSNNNTTSNNNNKGGKGGAVQNKSSFLAGIMRRILRNQELQKLAGHHNMSNMNNKGSSSSNNNTNNYASNNKEEDEGEEEEEEDEEAKRKEIEESLADVDELVKLVGTPHAEDRLLYAVPVCGPYLSLQNLRYKIKLTPGTLKKGKAVKTAVELFTRMKDISVAEKQLMKTFTDNELVATMIGEVKLSMPGLQQQKQQMKKKAKRG